VEINSNFKNLLRLFAEGDVRYLVVGGYAVMKYTEPYTTKGLDLWIEPTPQNADAVLRCLRQFGAPAAGITVDHLLNPDLVYQIGVEPVRVDVMSAVPGLTFADAWTRRAAADFSGISVPILSIDDLIIAKQTAGRKKDRLQARQLLRAKSLRSRPPEKRKDL
jgi:predicted nucleotidyltransferase